MKDRLKKIRLQLGYNLLQMADKLGIEANTYKGYEYKTKNLPCDFLCLLITKLNVNINWLLTGEGDMFIPLKFEEVEDEFTAKVKEVLRELGMYKS